MLSQAILDPGDEIVCGWPSFPSYVIYARKQGADARRSCRCATTATTSTALLAAITPRTKLVYICHPNNPTGTMNTADELDAYFERVPGARARPSSTRRTSSTSTAPDYPDAVERYLKRGPRVVVLRTFSKIYGLAGLRVGYAVGAAGVCARDGEGAAAVRPDDARAGRARSRASATTPRSRAAAPSTPTGLARLEAILREHGLRAGAVGRQLPLRRHRRAMRPRSSSGCCTKA